MAGPATQQQRRSLVQQLLLASLGGLILLITGAWVLPGLPLALGIALLWDCTSLLAWIKATRAYSVISRAAEAVSSRLLIDPRNRELMWVNLACAACTTLLTANLVLQQLADPHHIPWRAFLLRQAVMAGCLAQAFSAKHRESHNRLPTYKHKLVQAVLGRINEWWLGIAYGNIPEIDRCGHGFMHHQNDLAIDDWGTAHLDRASLWSFLQYVVTAGVFHNSGLGPQLHFAASKVWGLNRQLGGGMAVFYGAAGLTWALGGWRLFVLLWAWPFVANCGYASVVNWTWHAFADPSDSTNYIGSTITVTAWPGDVFAEGFHVAHHLRPTEHYSLSRNHLQTHRALYAAHNCIVLHGGEPLSIWVNLMCKNWGFFANLLADFSGQMSPAHKRAFCRYRTRPLGSQPADKVEAAAVVMAAKAQQAAAAQLAVEKASKAAATGAKK